MGIWDSGEAEKQGGERRTEPQARELRQETEERGERGQQSRGLFLGLLWLLNTRVAPPGIAGPAPQPHWQGRAGSL